MRPVPTHKLALRPTPQHRTEFSDRHPQRLRDAADVDKRRVALTALDAADVGVVQSCPMCEFFLGEAALLAKFPHPPSKRRPQVAHAPNRGRA